MAYQGHTANWRCDPGVRLAFQATAFSSNPLYLVGLCTDKSSLLPTVVICVQSALKYLSEGPGRWRTPSKSLTLSFQEARCPSPPQRPPIPQILKPLVFPSPSPLAGIGMGWSPAPSPSSSSQHPPLPPHLCTCLLMAEDYH